MIDEQRAVTDLPWAVVDVETTGLFPESGDRVCEIAVLRAEPDGEVEIFSSLVNPGRPILPAASAVNGLSDADVVDAPPFAALLVDVHRWIDDAVFVAHNATFDVDFLAAEYALAGMTPPDVPVVDTLSLARRHFSFARNTLGALADGFGVRPGRLHRAEGDVQTTYRLLRSMLTQLSDRGLYTLDALLRSQGAPITFTASTKTELPAPLSAAVRDKQPIGIRYQGRRTTERVIEPLRVRRGYLIAFCRLRQANRTFRLDRIVDAWWP